MHIKGRIGEDDFMAALHDRDSKVSGLLRQHVDEWIDSGRDGERENFKERTLAKAPTACSALYRYINDYPPQISLRTHSVVPLSKDPDDNMVIADDGFEIYFGMGHAFQPDAARHVPDQAASLFAQLIDSDWKHRLLKCRRCNKYELLPRNPPGPRRNGEIGYNYIRGAHCKKCRSVATAMRSTEKSLGERQARRLAAAARAWLSWKEHYGNRKSWIRDRMNQELPSQYDHIKIRWVTTNLSKIEQAVAEVTK